MIKSMRLRLQLFHAIILTVVVILFGGAFYDQLHRSTMREIDAGLLSGARVLEGTLRSISRIDDEESIGQLPLALPRMFDRYRPPPPGQMRGDVQRPPQPPPPEMRDELMSIPYFAIFADDGRPLRFEPSSIPVTWTAMRRPVDYRQIDDRREVLVLGPRRMLIVVGRSIRAESQRLTASLIQLCVIGTGVTCLGLIGGWWLVGRAIRPIEQISRTAAGITERNLAERIDTANMDHELRSLGTTLNTMLSRIEIAFEKQCQFTADASHDLRTPLAIILSHCELALSRPRSPEDYQMALRTCLSTGARMKSLVDGLLLLALSDAGELKLQLAPVDLMELASEAIQFFSAYAAERRVELQLVGDVAPCMADRVAISQVISNLVDNAILYNRESGGRVTLNVRCESDAAILEVHDTGQGIPTDALPRIFDRFFRVDQTRTGQDAVAGHSGSGSGLGLAICKSIVDAHNGKITATSEPTVGSVFVVQLPRN